MEKKYSEKIGSFKAEVTLMVIILKVSLLTIITIGAYIVSGCAAMHIPSIITCNNKIQTTKLELIKREDGIEILFPAEYDLFDIVFTADKENIGRYAYFHRWEGNNQVWLYTDKEPVIEVYSKYGDKYCRWLINK